MKLQPNDKIPLNLQYTYKLIPFVRELNDGEMILYYTEKFIEYGKSVIFGSRMVLFLQHRKTLHNFIFLFLNTLKNSIR
jgi:hypothetical protein